ncbi:hypothetical protein NPIL_136181 [Nephila pilipes]|uniref:Uncharacterized protein n=1 Tax=Nephila pilipes TaxID=299642 RepID=A0A8X6QX31_NEPPI|nr:hypothetical protein NPIL_136181 [Nephila pilipes]
MLEEGGHWNFVRALWTEFMQPNLYRKAGVAWHRCRPQDLSQWQTLGRAAICTALLGQTLCLESPRRVPFVHPGCIGP